MAGCGLVKAYGGVRFMVNVVAEMAGSVWQVVSAEGQTVTEGDELLILESMKMEIPVLATRSGVVKSLPVAEGEAVAEGQVLAIIEP